MRPTRQDWRGAFPVFVLTITWNGRVFYASTIPMQVTSSRGDIQLQGGLTEDPEFSSSMSARGFQVSSYSTSISVYLQNVDIAKQAEQGNTLEGSKAELSYLLVQGDTVQSYDDRVALLAGLIKEPVYGHFDRSNGYVECSIETEVLETSLHNTSMGEVARIGPTELSDLVNPTISPLTAIQDANYILDVLEVHKGKILPIVFGEAGVVYDFEDNAINYPSTPAYIIYAQHGSSNKIWMAIAPHAVNASRVRVYDDLGNNRVEDVEQWVRSDGRIFSFVHFTHSSASFQNPVDDESARYFCSWFDGGGLVSPNTNEAITGAGDICLWVLSRGGQDIDYAAWESVSGFLNTYKLSGYINNESISPLEFLENEIVPLLPISIVQGSGGVKPIIDIFASGIKVTAIVSITASAEFTSSSGIQQSGDTSSLLNDFTLEYAYDPKEGAYKASMRITGEQEHIGKTITTNDLCEKSFNRYGSRSNTIQTNFVSDQATASLICFNMVRSKAFPATFLQYRCSPRFGWLEIGDIIALTDENFTFSGKLVQVTDKIWDVNSWMLTVKIAPEGV